MFRATSPAPVLVAVLSVFNTYVVRICSGFSVGSKAVSFMCLSFGQFV